MMATFTNKLLFTRSVNNLAKQMRKEKSYMLKKSTSSESCSVIYQGVDIYIYIYMRMLTSFSSLSTLAWLR